MVTVKLVGPSLELLHQRERAAAAGAGVGGGVGGVGGVGGAGGAEGTTQISFLVFFSFPRNFRHSFTIFPPAIPVGNFPLCPPT